MALETNTLVGAGLATSCFEGLGRYTVIVYILISIPLGIFVLSVYFTTHKRIVSNSEKVQFAVLYVQFCVLMQVVSPLTSHFHYANTTEFGTYLVNLYGFALDVLALSIFNVFFRSRLSDNIWLVYSKWNVFSKSNSAANKFGVGVILLINLLTFSWGVYFISRIFSLAPLSTTVVFLGSLTVWATFVSNMWHWRIHWGGRSPNLLGVFALFESTTSSTLAVRGRLVSIAMDTGVVTGGNVSNILWFLTTNRHGQKILVEVKNFTQCVAGKNGHCWKAYEPLIQACETISAYKRRTGEINMNQIKESMTLAAEKQALFRKNNPPQIEHLPYKPVQAVKDKLEYELSKGADCSSAQMLHLILQNARAIHTASHGGSDAQETQCAHDVAQMMNNYANKPGHSFLIESALGSSSKNGVGHAGELAGQSLSVTGLSFVNKDSEQDVEVFIPPRGKLDKQNAGDVVSVPPHILRNEKFFDRYIADHGKCSQIKDADSLHLEDNLLRKAAKSGKADRTVIIHDNLELRVTHNMPKALDSVNRDLVLMGNEIPRSVSQQQIRELEAQQEQVLSQSLSSKKELISGISKFTKNGYAKSHHSYSGNDGHPTVRSYRSVVEA